MESKSGEATLQTWIEYHGLTSLTLEHAARLEVLMLTTEKQAYANGFDAGYSAGRAEALKEVRKLARENKSPHTSGHGEVDYYIFWETFDNLLTEKLKEQPK